MKTWEKTNHKKNFHFFIDILKSSSEQQAVVNDFFFVACEMWRIQGEGNECKTEQFRVLDDGTNQILDRGTYFCGQGVIKIQSRSNFITFGEKLRWF